MRFIFDSHLDLAWNALTWKRDLTLPLAEINKQEESLSDTVFRGRATTSLPEMRAGGIMLCLGTMMGRVPYGNEPVVHGSSLDFPNHQIAWAFAQGQLAYYRALEEAHEIRGIRNANDLGNYWHELKQLDPQNGKRHPIGMILAMEGADAIIEPAQLDRWWSDGLRVLSLVHYGVSAYAHGTGTEGPLTPLGKELLKNMERVGMILDVTHLSDQSFQETTATFDGPLFASHQNCRSLVAGQRQFSDDAIRIVIERGGTIGVALDAWMLDPNWKRPSLDETGSSTANVSLENLADHIEHICRLAGNTLHVAIGSDLDGGYGTEQTPHELKSIADLQKLDDILERRGFDSEDRDRFFHQNHLRFFQEHLP